MKVFITGGTGFIGGNLSRAFVENGHHVTVLSRGNKVYSEGVKFVKGDPSIQGDWQDELIKNDIVINLAGASIFKKWSKEYKEVLKYSRVLSTKNVVDAIKELELTGIRTGIGKNEKAGKISEEHKNKEEKNKKLILFNASAVGYYGFRREDSDKELTESDKPGNDFLSKLTLVWESKAQEAERYGARVILCRFGIVLGKGGGALSEIVRPFKYHLGAQLGDGEQWFSWIHIQDLINIFFFLLREENRDICGPINFTSPNPVRNREFTEILERVLNKKQFLPKIPPYLLELALGELSQLTLKGQRVIPEKLMKAGYEFRYSLIEHALRDLLTE